MQIIYSEQHKLHAPNEILIDGRPFDTEDFPARAEFILAAVQAAQIGTVHLPSDHGMGPLQAIHTADYLDHLQHIYAENSVRHKQPSPVFAETFATRGVRRKTRQIEGRKGYYCFGVGSPILEHTWQAAYWSAQCALSGADRLLTGDSSVYALCRPPGHHAAVDMYGGFCYLNNAAIAARYLGEKVAILDIDYHHGNGTQEIFYRDASVLFCSIHIDPDLDYPYYWGGADERGEGPGQGFNRNWPMPRGIEDEAYLLVLEQALEVIGKYAPRYLIVSAGLDIAAGDAVGSFRITPGGFREIGRHIRRLGIPTLVVQEGGYLLDRLGENVVAFLSAFAA
jgi:acetoin utilization deacetylase AcuC-like enzyme